jgi:outer membrane protein OmpA-like peptidoglycan-associated protein
MLVVSFFCPAWADDVVVPALNAQLFHATVDGDLGLTVDDAVLADDRHVSARIAFQYVNDPVVYEYEDGERVEIVSDLVTTDVLAGFTLGRLRAGVDLPVHVASFSDVAGTGTSLGDAALDLKVTALDPLQAPFGLAVAGRLLLPTGATDRALGSGAVAYELGLVGSQSWGPWRVAANVTTRGVPETDVGDATWGSHLVARAGVAREVGDRAGLSLELAAASVYTSMLVDRATSPTEAMLGGWYRVGSATVLRLGGGTGLTRGIGAPAGRVIAAVGYEPPRTPDTDVDGLVDRMDRCVTDPEDRDQFEDADGCPDRDDDRDGLADADDGCRLSPEDPDGFEDGDGCPERDNDEDGFVDLLDRCPMKPEDTDKWEDDDGCPEPTRVDLRIVDAAGNRIPFTATRLGEFTGGAEATLLVEAGARKLVAEAPGWKTLEEALEVPAGAPVEIRRVLEPAEVVGTLELRVTSPEGKPVEATWAWSEADGAWNLDEHAIPGGVASALMPPGTYRVNVRAEGYAHTTQSIRIRDAQTTMLAVVLQPSRVVVTKEKLEIRERVYFDTGKTTIRRVSFGLLDEVARVLHDHPELKRVRIEGHTDSRGSDVANLKLSDGRAKAVLSYLKKAGIAAERLDAIGFGESKPVDPTETPVAWDKNRRVEFMITEQE